MVNNVVSLKEKLEIWKLVYQRGDLRVDVSTHGRFKFHHGGNVTQLDFFDSVLLLKELSEALEITMDDMGMYNANY